MDSKKLIESLNKEPEMNPDLHDGSYELMREIVESYSHVDSYSVLNYKDLNAVYAMAIGTWRLNVEKKKEYVNAGHLPEDEKETMVDVIDEVWDHACRGKYNNREGKGPSIGMFGTGFNSFERNTDDISCQKFIKMLVDIADMTDDEQIFSRAQMVFTNSFKGMQAAAASVILHCLKPTTFPILNSNHGAGTIYYALGIDTHNEGRLVDYIDNCRKIKYFRDTNLKIKNYRILDRYPHIHPELFNDIEQPVKNDVVDDYEPEEAEEMTDIISKNTILYGPPGTGKTFNTVLYAVAIIENKTIEEISKEAVTDYSVVKNRYDEYLNKGRIAFTTFHQSYGYEEFIEGIKPIMTDGEEDIGYRIESGIFKEFCDRASMPSPQDANSYGINKDPAVWKVSLGGTRDNHVRRECMENNHIRIGWDSYGPDIADRMDELESGKRVLNAFYNVMRVGDIVLSCYSATEIDAVGVVIGDCEWDDSYSQYKRLRKVRWLVKGIREDIVELNKGYQMTLATVYWMSIPVRDILNIVEKNLHQGIDKIPANAEKYVFVIDEINRGNISKVFGELITLIEESKRIGSAEEMTVELPYSHNRFGVPNNVYIIGTMNTADRSIAIMDTALRRRFSFVEMLPDSDVLRNMGDPVVYQNGVSVNVADMLDIINDRIIFLYDREHTIGHAFFMPLISNPSVEVLATIFEKSIIPLLQEYFYEDYAKIQLVLGDDGKKEDKKQYQFITDEDMYANKIFETVPELEPEKKYKINYPAFREIESYKYISKNL